MGEKTNADPEAGTDAGAAADPDDGFDVRRWAAAATPLVLLAVVVGFVVLVPPFAGVQAGEPLPDVSVSHATLADDEITLHVTNNGPGEVTIQQVLVNDAYWDFTVGDGGEGARTLAPMESTTVTIPYHWQAGWDVHTTLVLSSGATVSHTIVAPQQRQGLGGDLLGQLAIVGLLVGVIPIALGMLWYPFMRDMDPRWLNAVLAFSGGVLAFLAFDAGFGAFEVAHDIPGAFEGPLLVVTGTLGTLLLVGAASNYLDRGGRLGNLGLAYLVAVAIGLHNLAEGLAIGGAVALGRVSLGAFLVVGFMVHNVTEGPAVVAPLADEERPPLVHFAAMGAIAGAPVILGGWVGSLAVAPVWGALALAAGVGAILQVEWELAEMVHARGSLGAPTVLLGFLAGLVVMYATDLLIGL